MSLDGPDHLHNHRIQVFDRQATLLTWKVGSKGKLSGQFNQPGGVTVNQRNYSIAVADSL